MNHPISLATLALIIATNAAHATPIKWTVSGFFYDSGRLAGTFIYDADVNSYSNIAIVTTPGLSFPGATYINFVPPDSSNPAFWGAGLQILGAQFNEGGPAGFGLGFLPYLTNQTMTVALYPGVEGRCLPNSPYVTPCYLEEDRRLVSGQAVGTPIPEPDTLTLTATLLGVMILAYQLRSRRVTRSACW